MTATVVATPGLQSRGTGHITAGAVAPSPQIAKWNKRLFKACQNADLEGVVLALDNGAQVNARRPHGATPLHFATGGESQTTEAHIHVVLTLFERGAELNAKDEQGGSPMHWAIRKDAQRLTLALVACGAEAPVSGFNNQTAIGKDHSEFSNQAALIARDSTRLRAAAQLGRPDLVLRAIAEDPEPKTLARRVHIDALFAKLVQEHRTFDVMKAWLAQRAAQEALDGLNQAGLAP